MIVSPGMTLLIAGVASGACFLLLNGVRSRKHSRAKEPKRVAVNDGRCACCLAPFLVGRGVRCSDCGARSCRKSCSRWDTSDNAWRCLFCYQKRSWIRSNEKWFENFGRTANQEDELHRFFGTAKSRVHVAGHAAASANADQVQENREERRIAHAVQNFVEKIVEGLVQNVDGTSIARAYEGIEYDKFLEDYLPPLTAALTRMVACLEASLTNKPSADPPAMAHAALREIVERAVEEARKLPGLNASADSPGHPHEGHAIADQSYEDLLATAILNKVVEKFQRERVDGNSNVLRNADQTKTKYASNESEHDLEKDAGSGASYHSASIRQNGDHREPVSFMMEERIEEVMTITSDGQHPNRDGILEYECARRVPFPEFGMDIVDPPRELSSPSPSMSSDSSDSNRNEHSRGRRRYRRNDEHAMDLISPIESWEDNWLFQKKKTARAQPDAVTMLVPSSNTYYKALIGDRDAEDTSDLSECSSTRSDEEIEKELIEAINDVVPGNRRLPECDAESNEEAVTTAQLGRDEVDEAQQVKTQLETSVAAACEDPNEEEVNAELTQPLLSEEKTVENKDRRDRCSESIATLITGAIGKENETKEEPKDTAERGERPIAVSAIVESSAQEDAHTEKLSERNDRGNVADENEEQRESEYTEHYDTAIQRHLDSLTKVEACPGESEIADETKNLTDEQLEKLESRSTEERESGCTEAEVQVSYAMLVVNHVDTAESDRLSAPPRPGTIAEREHKKWENAPPIENNPYSEENIRKRSLERRYSRKAADISGAQYDVPKANDVGLEVLLTPDKPDIRRFGRDYYINQSKAASGERLEWARSAISSLSRPSSSLSQRSSSAGDEQRERQEPITSGETDDVSVLREDKDARTAASWRRNNVEVINPETNNRAVNPRATAADVDQQRAKCEKDSRKADEVWKEQRADDILEDQRKNSKNVINAKLNNQDHGLEAERKDEKERKVRKIDLKAYGFENEFSQEKTARQQQQPPRMVSRLDLRNFGYQDGLRRARSNIQLDQPRNNEKSNLTRCTIDREMYGSAEYKGYQLEAPMSLDCKDFANGSRELGKLHERVEKVGPLVSAKSMPNVTATADDVYYYANPARVNDEDENELSARNLLDRVCDRSGRDGDKCDAMDNGSLNDYETSSDLDSPSFEDVCVRDKEQVRAADEKLPMPSVKRLAEAFSGQQTSLVEPKSAKVNRNLVIRVDDVKDRSSTPEIQIVETPRQMHSLTARSLSKEFRDGLRQMPGKVSSPPVTRSLTEEPPANIRTDIVRSKRDGNDIAAISSGKFKSNIMFWEQMQKRNHQS